jgi:hypothetical protein
MKCTRFRETLTLLLLLLLVGCGRPPLRVHQEGDSVIIDVATLGEYPTAIKRLRILSQSNDAVVWEISASTGLAELWSVELSLGSNPSQPPEALHGEFSVVFPLDVDAFSLEPNVMYRIEAWGSGRWPARVEITLEPVHR